MSYILDALKKADAERRKEQVPGLHSQPLPATTTTREPTAWWRMAVTAGTAVVGAAVATGAVLWFRTPAQPIPDQSARSHTTAAPAIVPATVPATVPASPAAHIASAIRNPTSDPGTRPFPDAVTTKPVSRIASTPISATAPIPAATPVDVHVLRPPNMRDLPDAIRREIPELKVGGYILGASAADRSIILNGRLMHEGEEAAPGITLERMEKDGMILRYREYRFFKPY